MTSRPNTIADISAAMREDPDYLTWNRSVAEAQIEEFALDLDAIAARLRAVIAEMRRYEAATGYDGCIIGGWATTLDGIVGEEGGAK